eukprot:CAMPEP_0202979474 /NCGR_PEP_ID=MMETSP1396-20130829/85604_1 /ASSEMBLY_ACC=CAM_ASM_000872 /TAXON_ID= /ORGANISM="Pseudokeronopsis sp., Strain Brazil" /LENGTH=306 /DNA_ID=CAMNT_0049718901 /DNA_START=546 /DNA_END=1466 /DNA_ORIENTATION=-
MKDYVYDFAWGYSASSPALKENMRKLDAPKERIFITHDPSATGHQNQKKKTWSPTVSLYVSDDFFKNKKVALSNGNSLIKTENYIFCAKANQEEKITIYVSTIWDGFMNFKPAVFKEDLGHAKTFTVKKVALSNGNSLIKTENYIFCAKANQEEKITIYVSTIWDGFMNFKPAVFKEDLGHAKTFTVMDSSEYSVFLHFQQHSESKPLGHIFVSDSSGHYYTESIQNVIRGVELVDFEKVNSLEGVFLANKATMKSTIKFSSKMASQDGMKGTTFTIEDELKEEEAEEEMMEQLKNSQDQSITNPK